MADFYFFTDVDAFMQVEGYQFGPISSSQYRYGNYFEKKETAITEPRVFAICEGMVYARPNASDPTNLIDLIHKPSIQPKAIIEGFEQDIKYFIYKGVLKNSLIDGLKIAPKENNELTSKIWDTQKRLDSAQEILETEPNANILKYNQNYLITDNIDILFYDFSSNFMMNQVEGGEFIGKFNPERFGLVIVLDDIGSKQDFSIFNDLESIITLTDKDNYDKKMLREEVLNYMDAAVFFGGFFAPQKGEDYENKKLAYRKSTDLENVFSFASGINIYTEILNPFLNKNRVYIDIRNQLGKSFNFFEEYTTPEFELELSNDSTVKSSLIPDYFNQDGWPIIIIDAIKTDGTSRYLLLSPNVDTISLDLRFPYNNEINKSPLIYLVNGFYYNKNDNLVYQIHINRFKKLKQKVSDIQTDSISLAVPRAINEALSIPIASYIKLKHTNDDSLREENSPSQPNKFHNLFNVSLVQNKNQYFASNMSELHVFNDGPFVQYSKRPPSLNDFASKIGYGLDSEYTFLFSFLNHRNSIYDNQNKIDLANAFDDKRNAISLVRSIEANFANREFDSFLEIDNLKFTDGTTTQYLNFEDRKFKGGAWPGKDPVPKNLNNEFIGVVLRNSTLSQAIIDSGLDRDRDIFLGFVEVDKLMDFNGKLYSKYRLTLMGYEKDSGNFKFSIWDSNSSSSTIVELFGLRYSDTRDEPMILVEKGTELTISEPKILYTNCELLKDPFFNKNFYNFVEKLKDADTLSHYHSSKIFNATFDFYDNPTPGLASESQIQVWKEFGAVNNEDFHVVIPSDPTKIKHGFLVEACLTYVLWQFYLQMTNNFIDTKLWAVIKKCLIDAGFKNPESTADELNLAQLIIGNNENQYGKQFVGWDKYNSNGLSGELQKLLQINQNNNLKNNALRFSEKGGDLIINFYKHFYNEIYRVVNIEVACLYNYFTGLNTFPESIVLAVGGGSRSSSFFNEWSKGLIFFKYAFRGTTESIGALFLDREIKEGEEQRINVKPSHVHVVKFNNINVDGYSTAVHLNYLGLDGNGDGYFDRKIRIYVDDKYYCKFIITETKKIIEAIDSSFEDPLRGTKIDYEGIELGAEVMADTFVDFYYEKPTKDGGIQKVKIATFDPVQLNLIFDNSTLGTKYKVEFESGYRDKALDDYDEMSLFVCITPGNPILNIEIEDFFKDDVFELTNEQKDTFSDTETKQKTFENLAKALKESSITSLNINIKLNAGFIGVKVSEYGLKVRTDPDYEFDENGPEKLELQNFNESIAKNIRYVYGTLALNNSSANINISSFVSPVWSRLDDKILDKDMRGTLTDRQNKKNNLDELTEYGLNNNSNAFVQLPDSSIIPSYNGVLSCFRSFALLEAMWYNTYKAAINLGYTGVDLNKVLTEFETAILSVEIPLDPKQGIGKNITFNDYKTFKWYPTKGLNSTEINNLISQYLWHPNDL